MRRWLVTICAVGSALTVVLGSGVLTLSSDSVTSSGNNIASDRLGGVATGGHDLRVALVKAQSGSRYPTVEACPAQANRYSNATTFPASLHGQTLSLATTTGETAGQDQDVVAASSDWICLKNFDPAGSAPANLRLSTAGIQHTEVGACEATEAEAGDPSCANGQSGELYKVVTLIVRGNFDRNPQCGAGGTSGVSLSSPGSFRMTELRGLNPGEVCPIWIMIRRQVATDQDRLQAQTDAVRWDMIFTLEDRAQ